jgi:DNA-binding transcriptional regulator YiaG
MPNIATVLKQEITRLARKEVNTQTRAMRKATAQYRRDIAELKRQVNALSKQVAYLERQERKRASTRVREASTEGRRFSARGLRTHREKLGFSAAEYAELVGVSAQTIYNWEHGKSKPRDAQLGSLVAVRELRKREALKRLELLEG